MLYRCVRMMITCTKEQDAAWRETIDRYQGEATAVQMSGSAHPLFLRQACLYRKKQRAGKGRAFGKMELQYWRGFHVETANNRLHFIDQRGCWHTILIAPDEHQQTILGQGRVVSMTLAHDDCGWYVKLLVRLPRAGC